MAVKTITIDMDAYEILARLKKPGESFSQVIKRRFAEKKTGAELHAALAGLRLSEEALDAIEHQAKMRRRSRARAAAL
jgi:predicted CopG family antitoxin